MTFFVSIDIDAVSFVHSLDGKSRRIIRNHLKKLENDPLPGKGGDKELLDLGPNVKIYRLHIARSFTAFYQIEGDHVLVSEILTIEHAHKKYKKL